MYSSDVSIEKKPFDYIEQQPENMDILFSICIFEIIYSKVRICTFKNDLQYLIRFSGV